MTEEPKRIGGEPRTTPPDLKSGPGAACELPDDVVRDAGRRFGIMLLVVAALWVMGIIMTHFFLRELLGLSAVPWAVDAVSVANILVSLGLYWYTRQGKANPRFLLDLSLVYFVLGSASGGIISHWVAPPAGWPATPMISWIAVAALIQAAIVPNKPGKMLVAALLGASMDPLGMLIANTRGIYSASLGDIFLMHYPNYICAAVAAVISHVVVGLGREVTKARELGSYRLAELIGRGGMGEVYRATHRMLARPAAIKLIRPESLGGGEPGRLALHRFRREAEAVASLRSPHTIELYDFGVAPDGTFYYVMELLDGLDLDTMIRRFGPMPPGRVIAVLRQVSESLMEAHSRGLVHRDIKPSNVHLCRMGLHYDVAKVLDFGLVKSVAGGYTDDSLATQANLAVGTPAYMAPEVALGGAVDGRADLYAVGCLGYWLLTGRLVFEGQSAMQIMAQHLSDPPVPPSRTTEVTVPPELERVVLHCLEKDRERRPASAAELRGMLAELSAGFPWTEAQAAQWWQTHLPAEEGQSHPGSRGSLASELVGAGIS